ncbi:uncharacterized protein [Venturia canescens]|uniref:uncharacterized protein n=1 Tax=Venturia canescens TaxID=32260 RepID=UPI001C9BD2B0|nr:uncharacterized protein LOC122417589 [Venturia canescens]
MWLLNVYVASLCVVLAKGSIQNDPKDFYAMIKGAFHDSSLCRNSPICHYVGMLRSDEKSEESVGRPTSMYRNKGETDLDSRSYYGGYGAPALYPAIDTVSVLASLAFLAFLLHSFASLFDRSRSIIPSVVSNRQLSEERGIPDSVKLVLRALDEYDTLSNGAIFEGLKTSSGKTTLR